MPADDIASRNDCLVADDGGAIGDGMGVAPCDPEILSDAHQEMCASLMQAVQTGEVPIAPIHDMDRAGFDIDLVQQMHIMLPRRRKADKRG